MGIYVYMGSTKMKYLRVVSKDEYGLTENPFETHITKMSAEKPITGYSGLNFKTPGEIIQAGYRLMEPPEKIVYKLRLMIQYIWWFEKI